MKKLMATVIMMSPVTLFLLLSLTLPVPTQAAAWKVGVKDATTGGTISVRGATPVTFANGTVYYNYTTTAANPNKVKILVDTSGSCYAIQKVVYNSSTVNNPSRPWTRDFSPADGTSQSAVAYFYVLPVSVSAGVSSSGGGQVSPTSASVFNCGSTPSSDIVFRFVPSTGGSVTSISNVPAGATQTGTFGTPNGTVTITISKATAATLTSNVTMIGTFSGVLANAGYTQIAFPGQLVTLSGSATPAAGATFSWTPAPGNPAPITLSGSNSATPSFTAPSVIGTYSLNLSVNGGAASATVTVYVTNSAPPAAAVLCANCHQTSGMSVSVYQSWSSSKHSRFTGSICQSCHVGTANGAHPGTLTSGTVNETTFSYVSNGANFCITCHNPSIVTAYNSSPHPSHSVLCGSCHTGGVHNPDFNATACDGCHRDSSGNVPLHPIAIGSTACISCHDPHGTSGSAANMTAAHYNNFTGAGYPASYVTSRSSCSDCHYYDPSNLTVRQQWYSTGHAATTKPAWTAYDFKTKSGCVQCHTTTGFIAYSTGKVTAAWGGASDKTKELLTCVGCHSNITTGALRSVTPVKPFADDSYQNRNVGSSNLCMDCHSGTNNGKSIQVKVGTADFTQLPFVAPHYMAAGGTLHGQAGYHFPGRTYAFYSSNTHRTIGIANVNGTGTGGPCVACHMSATDQHH